MRRKKVGLLLTLGVVLAVACCIGYTRFIEKKIYEESTSHLEEIYTQVNTSFTSLVSKNWNLLKDWEYYIHDAVKNEEPALTDFIQQAKDQWNITYFYFLDRSGNFFTFSGMTGYLDLGPQLLQLMLEGENVVVDGTLPNGKSLTIFAVPVEEGRYKGFEYTAIGIGYNNEDMERALNVEAFSGQSDCYVVYPDGRVLLSTRVKDAQPYNYMAYLSENAALEDGDAERIGRELETGSTGTAQFRIGADEYYLIYQPVGFQGWMMLGIVPKDVVNANMSQIQQVMVLVMSLTFSLIAVVGLAYFRQQSRRDIHHKELEIRYREQLFGMLASNVDDIFVMFSTGNYAVEYVSSNVERVLGIPAEAVKSDIRVLKSSAIGSEDDLLSGDLGAMALGEFWKKDRERLHQQTGERRWYQETLYRVSIENTDKFILVLSDRTSERQNHNRLQQALDIAKSANKAKSRFLANMSHDIRTPINAIIGMTQIAKDRLAMDEPGKETQQVGDCLDKIRISSRHLLSLINDVLDMSKIEGGQISLQEDACRLDEIVEGIVAIVGPQAAARSQTLTVDTAGVVHRSFAGDRLRLNKILLNLLSNAVKYTGEGGWIRFGVDELESDNPNYAVLRFTVADNGMGMSPTFMERIFEPFSRSEQAIAAQIQGTGLGMSITRAVVDAMGGTITVASRENEGTSFCVILEFRRESMEEPFPAEKPETGERYDYRGRRFLLAEDNELNAEILIALLKMQGADVEWAVNGEEAVQKFQNHPPGYYDAIFMDVMMPRMNGYEATAAIRKLPRGDAAAIRIIAMTANAFVEDVQAALDAGMNAHVSKPVDMDRLAYLLNKL